MYTIKADESLLGISSKRKHDNQELRNAISTCLEISIDKIEIYKIDDDLQDCTENGLIYLEIRSIDNLYLQYIELGLVRYKHCIQLPDFLLCMASLIQDEIFTLIDIRKALLCRNN